MKKFVNFLLMFMSVIGCIGGIAYCVRCGAYHIAVGVAVLAYSAWPSIKGYYNGMIL